MSNALTDDVFSQLQGAPLQQMAQQLGIGPAQMAGAVSAALPLLLGTLGRNASQPQGAEALFGALQRDHRGGDLGSILGAVLGGTGGGRQTDGAGILGHVFGGQQPRAEMALGQATGLGNDRAGMLLKMLAPIVLAYLAKRLFEQRQQQAATPQQLGEALDAERAQIGAQGGVSGGLLDALDHDRDGKLDMADLRKLGESLLGGLR